MSTFDYVVVNLVKYSSIFDKLVFVMVLLTFLYVLKTYFGMANALDEINNQLKIKK